MNIKWMIACIAIAAAPVQAQTIAITNARVHTISGAIIDNGTVLIRDGRIAAVGAAVAIPAGTRVIDATGKIVTPGLLDSSTGLGTVEIDAAAGSNDRSATGDHVTAALNAADNLNAYSTLIPVTYVEGITRAIVAPANGSTIIAGQGVLIDLGAADLNITIHRNPAAMYAVLGEAGASRAGGSRSAALLRLREA